MSKTQKIWDFLLSFLGFAHYFVLKFSNFKAFLVVLIQKLRARREFTALTAEKASYGFLV